MRQPVGGNVLTNVTRDSTSNMADGDVEHVITPLTMNHAFIGCDGDVAFMNPTGCLRITHYGSCAPR